MFSLLLLIVLGRHLAKQAQKLEEPVWKWVTLLVAGWYVVQLGLVAVCMATVAYISQEPFWAQRATGWFFAYQMIGLVGSVGVFYYLRHRLHKLSLPVRQFAIEEHLVE